MRWFPIVQWAERGGYGVSAAGAHGNSVPRFHLTWGTGPGVLEPFLRRVRTAVDNGTIELRFRRRVTPWRRMTARVTGVTGRLWPRATSRGACEVRGRLSATSHVGAEAVIVASGGIGGNHELVRRNWPASWGAAPTHMISGVPDHVDGAMLGVTERAGGRVINADRMWHYPEGILNHSPVWTAHGIRILSGPSPLWLDARG